MEERSVICGVTIKAKTGCGFRVDDLIVGEERAGNVLVVEVLDLGDTNCQYKVVEVYTGSYDHPMRPTPVAKMITLGKYIRYGWCEKKPASDFKPGELIQGVQTEKLPITRIVAETAETITFEVEHHLSENEYFNGNSTHEVTYLRDYRLGVGLVIILDVRECRKRVLLSSYKAIQLH